MKDPFENPEILYTNEEQAFLRRYFLVLLSHGEQPLVEYREMADRITADPEMVFAFAERFLETLTVDEAAILKSLYQAQIQHLASKGLSDYGPILMDLITNDLKHALEKTFSPREEEDAFHEAKEMLILTSRRAQVQDFDARNPLQLTAAEATQALRDFYLLYDPNRHRITGDIQRDIDRIKTYIRLIVPISQDPNLN